MLVLAGAGGCSSDSSSARQPAPRVFDVEGMVCDGCVETVTGTLKGLPGVESAEVNLAEKKATVTADPQKLPDAEITAAIEKAGYQAKRRP